MTEKIRPYPGEEPVKPRRAQEDEEEGREPRPFDDDIDEQPVPL